jgi:catechol 2,3-dioxygenase-like lactoylglutathione lyase family enzyme
MFKNNPAFSSFSVKDLQKAKEFYGRTLGLDVREIPEGLQLQISGGGTVFIYAKPNHTPATFTILNFSVENVEKAVAALGKQGVRFERYDQDDIKTDERGIFGGPGMRVAWFKDPAGNILSVLEQN